MATKKWWLAEEIRVIVPDFDARVEAHLATLPPKARPGNELTRLREEVARLKGERDEQP